MTAAKTGPPISTVKDSKIPNECLQVPKVLTSAKKYPQVLKYTDLTVSST